MSEQAYSELCYGGRPFTRRSSGAGRGRRKNPWDRDGNIMTCDECGADDHFRADCPRRGQPQRSMIPPPVPSSIQDLGPLGDLFLYTNRAPASTPETVQSYATTIPADQTTPIPRTDWRYYTPSVDTPTLNVSRNEKNDIAENMQQQ